jgi:hypothetical protein
MSDIGRPIKIGRIERIEVPEIVSVPVRPSERAAKRRDDAERRREEWVRRIERELPQPVEPVKVPVKAPEKVE